MPGSGAAAAYGDRVQLRRLMRPIGDAARRLRDRRGHRPPPRSTVLDDIADRRPANLVVRAYRQLGRRRHRGGSATLVLVTWNNALIIDDVLRAVRRHSPADLPILVVDNGSSDATVEIVRSHEDVGLLRLPRNIGHGPAIDLALCRVRSKVAIMLDSDAFPIRDDWLDAALVPLRSPGVVIAGSRASRGFVHPMFCALEVQEVLARRLSFAVYRRPGVVVGAERWGIDAFDTGEWLSRCLDEHEKHFIDRTPNPVSGLPGMTAGGVVYHHGGVSRAGAVDESWRNAIRRLSDSAP